jgi:hypothetical protein
MEPIAHFLSAKYEIIRLSTACRVPERSQCSRSRRPEGSALAGHAFASFGLNAILGLFPSQILGDEYLHFVKVDVPPSQGQQFTHSQAQDPRLCKTEPCVPPPLLK